MSTKGDIAFVQSHLISTLDKKETLATLRTWREESTAPEEADLLTELIKLVDSGDLDG